MKAETAQSQAKAENKTLQNLVQQFYQLNASEVQTVDKKRFDTLSITLVSFSIKKSLTWAEPGQNLEKDTP